MLAFVSANTTSCARKSFDRYLACPSAAVRLPPISLQTLSQSAVPNIVTVASSSASSISSHGRCETVAVTAGG